MEMHWLESFWQKNAAECGEHAQPHLTSEELTPIKPNQVSSLRTLVRPLMSPPSMPTSFSKESRSGACAR